METETMYRHTGPNGENLRLQATSYETRDPRTEGSAGRIAQAHVWEDTYRNGESVSVATPFWPHASHRFASAKDANAAALRGAARWIDEGRPPVPLVGP